MVFLQVFIVIVALCVVYFQGYKKGCGIVQYRNLHITKQFLEELSRIDVDKEEANSIIARCFSAINDITVPKKVRWWEIFI